jgi:transcriptional regulator with XRE-family HTH domain
MEMSRDQLGQELGVSLKQIQKYESGKNRMNAPRLYDNRLDISLDSPDARARPPRNGPAGATSVTTVPGQRPEESTSAMVSSAIRFCSSL